MSEKRKVKALSMFSGGLDSLLATKLVMNLGVEVLALHFTAPFIEPATRPGKYESIAQWAKKLEVPLRSVPMGCDFIEVIRHPQYGHGKGLNPCIDCKFYMLRQAGEIMRKEGFDFVFTGEVLGQRPMSQRRDAMAAIEKHSDLKGRLLRPLCAQFMNPTIPEEEGLIDRSQLLAISGRGRKPQLELAEKLGIADPPGSAGGCLLTDAIYSSRLTHLLSIKKEIVDADLYLLTVGRHIAIGSNAKVVVGRNEKENELLVRFREAGEVLLEPQDWTGPSALLINSNDRTDLEFAAGCILHYGKQTSESLVSIYNNRNGEKFTLTATPTETAKIEQHIITA